MRRLLLAALAGVLACSRSSEPVYIGVAGPWKEEYGRMNKQGIDLAVAHINLPACLSPTGESWRLSVT